MVSELIQALITVLVLGYCVWQAHESRTEREALVREYARERELLLERIQHPEIVRVQEVTSEVLPFDDTTEEIYNLTKVDR